ncbi:uncharacterized protein [Euwallacea similis]|uniref:uncharacterized protein isoform X9 n=1 Tax=Euwallacea similis TaxID=1736056 RepID=UPI00344F1BB4
MEVLWAFFWVFVVLLLYIFLLWRIRVRERGSEYYRIPCQVPQVLLYPLPDDNGIYNISSRVQGQQSQYPDAYLSVDHITISNELNKPPKYDDAPPSYEEAVKLAMAHSNSIQTFQAEQVNNTRPQAHSSTTTTVVVPAVAGQSTE